MNKKRVMIIDDEPDNLNILESVLSHENYEIAAFPRGDLALKAALNIAPDIVLLDIRMPVMDGYTVCKHFKKNPLLKDIPIIFLSALTDSKDKVHAFNVGGIDYVTKPFSESEVISRVKTHIQLRDYQLHLEELVRERTENLTEAYRRLKIWDDAKDQWLSVLAHEIRTPLNGIFGTMQLLMKETNKDISNLAEIFYTSMNRMTKLVDDALLLLKIKVDSKNYVSELEPIKISIILKELLPGLRDNSDIQIELKNLNDTIIMGKQFLLYQALEDLLQTSIKCLKPGQRIDIETTRTNKHSIVYIIAKGNRLKEKDIDSFFHTFGQKNLYRGGGDFGLGPALAKSIINLLNGSIAVRNQNNENGFVIEIYFPVIE